MRKRFAVASTGLVAALTMGGAGTSASAAGARPASGVERLRFESGGLERDARIYIPKKLASQPAMVVVLHGGFGTSASAARQGGWDAAARRHGFVAVYPDGVMRAWNAGSCCGPPMRRGVDDVGFLVTLIDRVHQAYGTDADRVFVTGISNGGMMAYRLACEASDRVAAIAPVAATLTFDGCAPAHPVSLLHIHGLADGNVPIEGGYPTTSFQRDPPSYRPVRDGITTFAAAAGCTANSTPGTTTLGRVTTERWAGCAPGTAVELVTIADGGHSWPGGHRLARVLDAPSDALDATSTIWQFFAAHPRARA